MNTFKPFVSFLWDSSKTDKNLQINNTTGEIKCLTSIGPHKNALGDVALYPGNISYWEVKILRGNHFKVGVTKSKTLKANGSFSDDENGWSYYSMGQKRHNDNEKGEEYGKPFGMEDTVGVLLDQYDGVLSFYLNGEPLGEAFQSEEFTNTPFYPFVSCLIQDEQFVLMTSDKED